VESTFIDFKGFSPFPIFWLTIGYVVKLPSTIIDLTHFTPTFVRLKVPAAGNDNLVDIFKNGRTVYYLVSNLRTIM
jgi:hypothetical protein